MCNGVNLGVSRGQVDPVETHGRPSSSADTHKLRKCEDGVPSDVLAELLPGDDIAVLDEFTLACGLIYRFTKHVFDILACGVALVILSVPWL